MRVICWIRDWFNLQLSFFICQKQRHFDSSGRGTWIARLLGCCCLRKKVAGKSKGKRYLTKLLVSIWGGVQQLNIPSLPHSTHLAPSDSSWSTYVSFLVDSKGRGIADPKKICNPNKFLEESVFVSVFLLHTLQGCGKLTIFLLLLSVSLQWTCQFISSRWIWLPKL